MFEFDEKFWIEIVAGTHIDSIWFLHFFCIVYFCRNQNNLEDLGKEEEETSNIGRRRKNWQKFINKNLWYGAIWQKNLVMFYFVFPSNKILDMFQDQSLTGLLCDVWRTWIWLNWNWLEKLLSTLLSLWLFLYMFFSLNG